nr:embryogenesis-associated protein EMB8-like [Tanacetum cinerariifolium]
MATVEPSFWQLLLIPISFYLVIVFTVLIIFLYILLEVHIIEDVLSGFRGNCVSLTVDSTSKFYKEVVSKCSLLHGRYFCTPWLFSPHLQTILFRFLVETHNFNYKRELFRCSDGGTIALDWLMNFD